MQLDKVTIGNAMIWNSDDGIEWRFEEVMQNPNWRNPEAVCAFSLLIELGKHPDILKELGFID